MYDILGIGEALVEFVETSPSVYRQSFAGDVLNTLYYCSRLGLRTSLLSSFGKESYTEDLERSLDHWGIDHSNCVRSKLKNNGVYIVRTDTDGEPQFTFFRENSAARETFVEAANLHLDTQIASTKAVIFSAIGLAIFRDIDRFVKELSSTKGDATVYFDTNVRTALWSDLDMLRNWFAVLPEVVDILSVSVSDDKKLFPPCSAIETLDRYRLYGFKKIILRNGPLEVLTSFDGKVETIPVQVVENVVDATGAGDAFNAGFLFGYLSNESTARCAVIGNRAASQVLLSRGGIVESFDPALVLQSE